jgi:hypothetical protein
VVELVPVLKETDPDPWTEPEAPDAIKQVPDESAIEQPLATLTLPPAAP